MEYLSNFLNEVLRIHSPSNGIFIREVQETHQISNIKVNKGMLVGVNWFGPCFNEIYYENSL